MGIDKSTIPSYINIVMDNNPEYIKLMKDRAESEDQNEEGENKLSLTSLDHSFEMEEFYFDDSSNEIHISGCMSCHEGKSFVFISLPLSDTVLIDILQHSLKKFNKLKTVLETLK